jgi:PAS domain S-box-containing protein
MQEVKPSLPTRQRLKLKILVPMCLGVLLFLGLYIISTAWYLEQQIHRNLRNTITDIDTSFRTLIDQRAQIMRTQLEQLAQSATLRQLMQQQDRSGLLAAAEPSFNLLREHMQISHYYFHNPDQTVFLRVHNPSRHGDIITRYTLQQAATTQKAVQGIELGPLGTYTLRTVIPWRLNGTLLGYLELGEEIELLLNKFFHFENSILALTIDKNLVDREQWEIGAEMLGKDLSEWDQLPQKIVLQTTAPAMRPAIFKTLKDNYSGSDQSIKLTYNKRSFQGLLQPMKDATGRQIGEFLVLHDISDTLHAYRRTVILFTALYLLATGCFLFFTSAILGKAETELKTTDQQLLDEMVKVHDTNVQLESEIEERKAAEAALNKIHEELEERVEERTEQLWLSLDQTRQTRKQLTDIITSVADALIVTDLFGKIKLLNPSAEQLLQCSAATCLEKPLKTIIQDTAVYKQLEGALQQQLSDQRIDFVQISPDLHKPVHLQVRTSVISGDNNDAAGMIFLIHDISHEREMERIKNEFISTAVHELSTPLTAVLGYSELLLSEQEYSPEERHEFLSIINEKSTFLSRLVGEILDISRIESGKPLELLIESHSASELFERPIRHFRHFSEDHPFSVDIKESDFTLNVDREKIWQVMENLCSNAVKYSPAGGEITIIGQPTGHGYQVTVRDQGVGMTEEQLAKVFEKFYRCNQSDTSIGGTGLGLTIVKGIIEAHSGKIWLESELGQGTSVHFSLPGKSNYTA